MNNFEVIIGIEVHAALNTKTKMFSPTTACHKSAVNTNINEIDLGHPGALPSVNAAAVCKGLYLARALHMKTNHHYIAFDRKHYYYIDLPKGYQITQQHHPIGYDGYLDIQINEKTPKQIKVNRIHLEEDTAKQTNFGEFVGLDYNRAGWPLLEIVTEPDLRNAQEAMAYLEELRKVLLFHDISDAKLEDGSMRADVNISVRLHGSESFGTKVEIKNINSISNVGKAIDYEIKRQTNLLLTNQTIQQETRRFDDQSNRTIFMRAKNNAINYRYIAEPNIAPICLSDQFVKELYAKQPHTLQSIREFLAAGNLPTAAIEQLLADQSLFKAFMHVNNLANNPSSVYKWVCLELIGLINKQNLNIEDLDKQTLSYIAEMIQMCDQARLNGKQAKIILEKIILTNKTPAALVKELGFEQITDETTLTNLLTSIIENNQAMVNQYSERADRVEKFIMGELMKQTKAQANPTISYEILKKLLSNK